MRCNVSLGLVRFAWVGLLLAAAPAVCLRGDEPADKDKKPKEQPATLRVMLPADARLTFDGESTRQMGPVRRFITPPLAPGKSYHYMVEWTYQKYGEPVTKKKVVHVRPGEETVEDLREESDKKPAGGKSSDKELDVIFVPTPQEVVDRMLELADVKKTDVVYDLGCGDGRIVVTAAKKYGCKAVGFDIDPRRVRQARANVEKNNVAELVTIEEKDLFKVDLRPASVVTLYLLPELNVRLIPQLEKLKPGSRIVSHAFGMKGLIKPKKVVEVKTRDGGSHKVYLWVTPLEKE